MNKKILVMSSVAVILIAVAGYWIYKDMSSSKPGNIVTEEPSETIGGITYEVSTTTPNTNISVEENAQFKKTASEIADMPIVFSVQMTEANKAKKIKAIEEVSAKIKADYNHLDLLLEDGILRQSIGDYAGAVKIWNFAGEVFPKNYASFQDAGFVQGFYLKDYKASEENYLKSLENDPTNIQIYLDLVDIYNFSGQAEKIPSFLKIGLKNAGDLNQAPIKILLAKYYAAIKDNANAIKYYEEVLSVDPSNTEVSQEIERLKSL
jgi:tetratricopeptide (TPR) repeat protein